MQEILQEYLSKEEKAFIFVITWKEYFTVLKFAKALGAKWLNGDEINIKKFFGIRKFSPCILAVGQKTLAFQSFVAAQIMDKTKILSFSDFFTIKA